VSGSANGEDRERLQMWGIGIPRTGNFDSKKVMRF
jgi:hypothetical protein